MSKILEIKQYSNQVLRKKSHRVKKITERELRIFENMLSTMHHASGIGLAAPQIGINEDLFVIDIGEGPIKLANPEIVKIKGKDVREEGCLSVPDILVKVARPYEIIVKGINEQGKDVEIKAKGLLARVILHEIDHLNGKLIVDYMNLFKKLRFKVCSRKSRES
ncbi:MAG: peptide deformylase [Omnitrophica bacterium]|nr:peptide deformylase [Candidatus Omnitrophota bacterium]